MIDNKSNELSILVYSCKKNSDMWDIFLQFKNRYWSDCSYKIVLLTDGYDSEEDVSGFDDVSVLDSTWYEMLMAGMEKADTPYVMLFMDDYLLCDRVSNEQIDEYVECMKKYHACNLRFGMRDKQIVKDFKKDDRFEIYKPGSAYSLSLQIGIWDVSFLKKYLKPEWNAWDFERIGSVEIADRKQPILGTKDYEFPYLEGVRKGKWLKQGYGLCKRTGIKPDFDKRPVMSDFETAWIYFKGGIMGLNPGIIQKMQNIWNSIKKK